MKKLEEGKEYSVEELASRMTMEELRANLSEDERLLLDRMKKFPLLDPGSQQRLRTEVNEQRKMSEWFNAAFGMSLGSALNNPKRFEKQNTGIFGSFADVITHPITAGKAKIGEILLKKRNKAPKIRVVGDPILKAIAEPIVFWEEKDSLKNLTEIVRKLGAALREATHGDKLGMAAPQIGISKRIFVCQGAVCVNPSFVPPSSSTMEEIIEGCYSVPNKLYKTKRHKYGWATWYSIEGHKREFKLKGLDAIVFQHELDHLDGKCCCDIGVEIERPKSV